VQVVLKALEVQVLVLASGLLLAAPVGFYCLVLVKLHGLWPITYHHLLRIAVAGCGLRLRAIRNQKSCRRSQIADADARPQTVATAAAAAA
jgi:hypothetical protein